MGVRLYCLIGHRDSVPILQGPEIAKLVRLDRLGIWEGMEVQIS